MGILIESGKGGRRKVFLIISIIANVGILSFFKYYNFFVGNIDALLGRAHLVAYSVPFLHIILPIGLSFHTFQAMSYTIEVYRGNQKAERHLGIYALYVMFYPQLVAGPIERPQNLLHQFRAEHRFQGDRFFDGLRLMIWGLFKKVVIADRLAIYVNDVYNHAGGYHYLNLVAATVFFSVQIYCDFSGYSDIAIGAAKTMGYDLMINFNRPYFSKNIQEFWKRWHISLSTWFRDYLYISLGGNRINLTRTYINVIIVFVVSGFWHGANWTYIIWGALHASYMVVYMLSRSFSKRKSSPGRLAAFGAWLITFGSVTMAWIFFRANSLRDASLIFRRILGRYHGSPFTLVVSEAAGKNTFGAVSTVIALCMIGIMVLVEKLSPPNLSNMGRRPLGDVLFCSAVIALITFFGVFHNTSFIYFQF
jgi:D-alanyl-lipoteichoic acid acyltransferase DltB (MBOAT superfamily)